MDFFNAPTVDLPAIEIKRVGLAYRELNSAFNSTNDITSHLISEQFPITQLSWVTVNGKNIVTAVCPSWSPHRLKTNDKIIIRGADQYQYNGEVTVTVIDHLQFTYSINTHYPTNPATGAITFSFPTFFYDASDTRFNYPMDRNLVPISKNNSWTYGFACAGSSELQPFYVEFYIKDKSFHIVTLNLQAGYKLYIDDVPTTPKMIKETGSSYPAFVICLTFNVEKIRKIKLEFFSNVQFVGVTTFKTDSLIKYEKEAKLKALFLGDSFGEGTGAANSRLGSFCHYIAKRMNWEIINGSLGSTGMTTFGVQGQGKDYIGRFLTMYSKYKPDIIFTFASVNDGGNITEVNAQNYINVLKSVCPNAILIFAGPVWPTETIPTSSLTSATNLRNICFKNGIIYLDGGIGLTSDIWINTNNKNTYYNGISATAVATVTSGTVNTITVSNKGKGYSFHSDLPTVTLSGGGGTGAVATPNMNFKVTDIVLLNKGSNYTEIPTVNIDSGVVAKAWRNNGSTIAAINIEENGETFITKPTITITGGGGTGATAEAVIHNGRLIRINMLNNGSGYTSDPEVIVNICSSKAIATATVSNGSVSSITIVSEGSFYTNVPKVIITGGGLTAAGAEAVAYLSGEVETVTVSSSGSGYASAPTVTISHPTLNDATHPKETGHQMLAARFCNLIEKNVI